MIQSKTYKRPHIKESKNKAYQKIYVAGEIFTITVGIGAASMAIWSFGLLFFKLEVIMYGSLGIVPSGTAANTTIVNHAHMQLL